MNLLANQSTATEKVWDKNANEFVKMLRQRSILSNTNIKISNIKLNGTLIQRVQSFNKEEYYQLGNQFFVIQHNHHNDEFVHELKPVNGSWLN